MRTKNSWNTGYWKNRAPKYKVLDIIQCGLKILGNHAGKRNTMDRNQ
jgi:hypothetical protein